MSALPVPEMPRPWREFRLPSFRLVRQTFPRPEVEDVPRAVEAAVQGALGERPLPPGTRVAVGIGSRGIAQMAEIAAAVVGTLREAGLLPFVVPAMGSHGGATAAGQCAVLAAYGVTAERLGCPVEDRMDTVRLGRLPDGTPVHFSAAAAAAGAVIPVNRIKRHTDFHGPVESGLAKMLAIGFGKHNGAVALHALGFATFRELIPAAAALILSRVAVPFGLAILENAYGEIAAVEAVAGDRLPEREPELMAEAARLMPGLRFPEADVLVVDEIGKDISGAGMDPNVTGRYLMPGLAGPFRVQRIVALGLSGHTAGNACGVGAADVITRGLLDGIDFGATYTNVITSTLVGGGRLPVVMESEVEAVQLGVFACNRLSPAGPRIARIRNTLDCTLVELSEPLWRTVADRPELGTVGDAYSWRPDPDGRLPRPWKD